jgi:hypothetical protein
LRFIEFLTRPALLAGFSFAGRSDQFPIDHGGEKRRGDNVSSIADRQNRHLFVQYEEGTNIDRIWDIGYQMQDDLKEQHQRRR